MPILRRVGSVAMRRSSGSAGKVSGTVCQMHGLWGYDKGVPNRQLLRDERYARGSGGSVEQEGGYIMLITIRVPDDTVKLQYIYEGEEGYDVTKTVTMGDIMSVQKEGPEVVMDERVLMQLGAIINERAPVRDE